MEHRQWVSRYREELKGLAILWVVFFHSQLTLPGAWDYVRQLGYGGVDIFLFLMGMGLFRSLSRQEDLRAYASRRLWRVLPAYLPVLVAWMAVMYPGYQLTLVQNIRGVAGNLLMVGYWIDTPKVFNWYANAQFLFYFTAPMFYAVLVRSKKPVRALVGLLGVCVGIGLANIGLDQMMGISRLPIFLLGMAFGMGIGVCGKKNLVRALDMLAFVGGVAAVLCCFAAKPILLNDFGMYWYPFVLITPPLCVGIAYCFHRWEKAARWFAPLRVIGRSSFEIYLINIWMVELAKKYGMSEPLFWVLLCVINLLAGVGYHALVARGTALLQAKKTNAAV